MKRSGQQNMGGLFDDVRAAVSARQAAEYYGLTFDCSGRRARCIWHSPDRHPSLSFKDGYCHCFSCGGGGSSIDLVARLFNVSPLEAAWKLASDFRLPIDLTDSRPPTGPSVYDVRRMLLDWRKKRLSALQRVTAAATVELAHYLPNDLAWDDSRFLRALRALTAAQHEVAQLDGADLETLMLFHREENRK